MVGINVDSSKYETCFSLTQLTENKISKNLATSFEQGYVLESDLGFKFFEFLITKVKNHL